MRAELICAPPRTVGAAPRRSRTGVPRVPGASATAFVSARVGRVGGRKRPKVLVAADVVAHRDLLPHWDARGASLHDRCFVDCDVMFVCVCC